ncbi:MAG: VanW family protein, partial [uncultured bacterium]
MTETKMQTESNTINLDQVNVPQEQEVFKVHRVTRYRVAKFLVVTLIGLLIFLIGGTISLISYQHAYAQRVLPNIYLLGSSVSGKSKAELTDQIDQISQNFAKKVNRLVISPEISIDTTFEESGLKIDVDKTVNSVYSIGKDGHMLTLAQELLSDSLNPKALPLVIKIDENKLNLLVTEKIMPQVKAPQDAAIEFNNGVVSVKPEENGLAINTESIKSDLVSLATNNESTALYIETKVIEPAIKKENLDELKTKLDSLVAQSFTLKAGEKTLHIKSEDLYKMIAFSKENGQIVAKVNSIELENYLLTNEKKLVIPKVDKQIVAGSNIVIREGKNGQKIDRTQAAQALNSSLASYFDQSAQLPQTITVATTEEVFAETVIDPKDLASASAIDRARGISGKMLVVDISEQRLTAFENGQVVNTFLISSGLPGMETPRGDFTLGRRVYSKLYSGPGFYLPNTLYNMN